MTATALTPAQMEAMIDQAWEDFQNEFAGCLGDVPDEETRAELRALFDKTVKNAIENFGALWEEPHVSYVLRHVCKIAKASTKCGDGMSTAKCLPIVAANVIEQARKTCTRLERQQSTAMKIGIFCMGS